MYPLHADRHGEFVAKILHQVASKSKPERCAMRDAKRIVGGINGVEYAKGVRFAPFAPEFPEESDVGAVAGALDGILLIRAGRSMVVDSRREAGTAVAASVGAGRRKYQRTNLRIRIGSGAHLNIELVGELFLNGANLHDVFDV